MRLSLKEAWGQVPTDAEIAQIYSLVGPRMRDVRAVVVGPRSYADALQRCKEIVEEQQISVISALENGEDGINATVISALLAKPGRVLQGSAIKK